MVFSKDEEIDRLRLHLQTIWPHIENWQQYDRFCGGFGKVWDAVSEANFYGPDLRIIPKDYKPNEEDAKAYIERIAAQNKDVG